VEDFEVVVGEEVVVEADADAEAEAEADAEADDVAAVPRISTLRTAGGL
jgi:hypothetical protein